ncbi:hypothetical protein FNV43_RR07685 [Rhamnella rubrinervis]|uniref:Disease resistance RPP13-like protein 4 n=1 Tax=Rhamnella rubrinervis TaxID=2594499 RepID=A0A8K0HH12_9ROSA|nr:hypothetical protein FNV43_RR07685 [Rhamnella rubrinervis]
MSFSALSSLKTSNEILTLDTVIDVVIPAVLQRLDKSKLSLSQSLPTSNNTGATTSNAHGDDDEYQRMANQVDKLSRDLVYIKDAFNRLKKFEESASHLFKALEQQCEHLDAPPLGPQDVALQKERIQNKLRLLGDIVIKLKRQIPSPHQIPSITLEGGRSYSSQFNTRQMVGKLPDLHASNEFKDSPEFKDLQVIYNSLDVTKKQCLLCFAVFPANEIVKKRILIHWWDGEGFLVNGKKTTKEVADEIFKELMDKGCIEPVGKKRRRFSDSFKMHPLVHSSVIVLAAEVGFFDFDKGSPTAKFSRSFRAALVKGSSQEIMKPDLNTEKLDPQKLDSEKLDPEKLQTIFNVNEPYPDFFKLEWFSKLRDVKVLYLGRWQNTAKHHIEVEDVEFLKGLKNMKHLRFFSLQGISRISKLPDSICMLSSLRILDLRACHNLEVLPNRIGSLRKLTYLDISQCYLLDYIPKGISMLSELQVLKGFIISDDKNGSSCTLSELLQLKKLRKLGINTSREDFPTEEELSTLQRFGMLQKLTIAWGGMSVFTQPANISGKENAIAQSSTPNALNNGGEKKKLSFSKTLTKLGTFKGVPRSDAGNQESLKELKKLDLQCYPRKEAPSWLMPDKLRSLKKLYIRGGELQNLTQNLRDQWTVETLRLKFLSELRMDWKELRKSFPSLIYLEKVKCPKLTFFPCDEGGIWVKP